MSPPSHSLVNKWNEWAQDNLPKTTKARNGKEYPSEWYAAQCECFLPSRNESLCNIKNPCYLVTFENGNGIGRPMRAFANDYGDMKECYSLSSHADGPRRDFGIEADMGDKFYSMEWIDKS